MLDKKYYYNKTLAICEEDLILLRELKKRKEFNKKSLAGINSFIIKYYKQYELEKS